MGKNKQYNIRIRLSSEDLDVLWHVRCFMDNIHFPNDDKPKISVALNDLYYRIYKQVLEAEKK